METQMWKVRIIDESGAKYIFYNDDLDITQWAEAAEWAESVLGKVDNFVNEPHSGEDFVPVTITGLTWIK